MDPTLKPIAEPKPSTEIHEKILAIIDGKCSAFWSDFYHALIPPHGAEEVGIALNSLVVDRTLRMKEDESEHDWEYRRV